jgi:ABC-type glycerol-3-phosphate transport system substrate-binding protein
MSPATPINTTRRSILAGLAAALPVAAAASGAVAASRQETDGRLVALSRQRHALKQRIDALSGEWSDEDLDTICRQLWAIEDEIVKAKAHSLTGLLVKLEAAQAGIAEQLTTAGAPEVAFADLCETIRALAASGSLNAVAA